MLIFAIDDEPKMLQNLHSAIAEAAPQARIRDFLLGSEALNAVQQEGLKPDVVFSDIRMPGVNGLELALRLKALHPDVGFVFVTGYDDYALEAFHCHANGYLLKPVEPEQIRQELDALSNLRLTPQPEKLSVQCFGYFEVFWKDKPLHFQRQQTKELLAYLISREGTACTNEQISTALWEDESALSVTNSRIRTLLSDLRSTLKSIGMEDVIIRRRGWIAVDRNRIDCDYYRMEDGEIAALNSFHGLFMQQYSWAELTAGELHFRFLNKAERQADY